MLDLHAQRFQVLSMYCHLQYLMAVFSKRGKNHLDVSYIHVSLYRPDLWSTARRIRPQIRRHIASTSAEPAKYVEEHNSMNVVMLKISKYTTFSSNVQ